MTEKRRQRTSAHLRSGFRTRPERADQSPQVKPLSSASATTGFIAQFLGVILMEDRMSITVKVSAGAAESINAPRQQSYLWTPVLIVGAIAACAIAAWFYVNVPLLDASMVGPSRTD
jgi:hypothetical protein